MKGKSFIVGLMVMTIAFVGCRPKGILHSWEMREVLVDLHKTDAMIQLANLQHGHEEARSLYYAQVLEQHGITQAEFDSSLVWYTAHPQLFDKIYPKVLAELEKEETQFLALHEEELHLNVGHNGKIVFADEIGAKQAQEPVFTKADLDSIIWVTQNGYPSSWNPLVHDSEDELLPQICIFR